jgi:hypothetical protein
MTYSSSQPPSRSTTGTCTRSRNARKLYAAPDKCEFYRTASEYLGHLVTPSGLSALPFKIEAVASWPPPRQVKDLRQFLGLTGFYRHFTQNYATIAAPLTDLLGPQPLQWSSRENQAFEGLKAALTNAPVLAFPDSTKPFVYGTDASDFAIGAVLQQDHGKGLQPIAFLSQKLTPHQVKYPVREKELFAIIEALCVWRHHLQGTAFTVKVLTDHVTLKYFTTQPKFSPCQVRWSELLTDFDLKIEHKPGRLNIVPDALSRCPDVKMLLFSALVDVAPTSDLITRIRMAYPQVPTTCHLIKTTSHANPAYRAMAGLLYHMDDSRYRLYVSDDAGIIRDILAHHHDHLSAGHPGQNRMERTLKQHFYWPGLHEGVSAYVRSCRHCQLHKSAAQPPAPQTTFPFPSQPFEEIALDWVGPLPVTPLGNDFLLNVTHRLTKFVVCIPCTQSMTKTQFAHALHHDLFCVHGSPRVVISDRDPRIDNDFIRQLEILQGISHRFTVAYRPQGNGQAKAINKEIITKLPMYCSDPSRAQDWDSTVRSAARAYNNTIHTAHGYTLFFLTHGYHPSSLYTLYWPSTQPPFPSSGTPAEVNDFRQHHAECLDLVCRHLTDDAAHRAQRHAAPMHRQPAFEIGDLVRISTVHLPRDPLDTKFSPWYLGPFVVSGHPSPNVYQIDFGAKFPNTHNHVNVDILRPYVQQSASRGLRPDEQDLPAIGGTGPDTEIESLVGRQRSRGRPRTDGRPHYTSIEFVSKTGICTTICG